MQKHTDNKGATLIEMLGVLSILGMISVGAMGGINSVYTRLQITRAVNQVTDLNKAMRQYFSAGLPTGVLTAEKLLDVGVFKPGDVIEGKAINVFGGEMSISDGSSDASAAAGEPNYILTYEGIPASACYDILMGDWGRDPSFGLHWITANGKIFIWERDNKGSWLNGIMYKLPIDSNDALAVCASSDGKNLTVKWSFYL